MHCKSYLHSCSKNISVSENTLATTVNEFVINKLVSRPQWLSWMHVRLVISRLLVQPPPGQQHSFMEIDHEIFSTVILSLLLIQDGQLSVSGKRMCTMHNTG